MIMAGLWFGVLGPQAIAGTITLKIRAINPSQTDKQSIEVRQPLPKLVKPDDVVSSDDLEVVYDVASKSYFVQKKVELEPAQTRTFDVVIKDIWLIPEETLNELTTHTTSLAAALKGADQAATADKLNTMIQENLKTVTERQGTYVVGIAKPIDHIRAYESNLEAMDRIRRDIGVLENLVISAGKTPQRLLGSPRGSPPAEAETGNTTGDVVTIHIKVTNPSLTEKRPISIKRDFPSEIKPTDVMDAGGLQIGFDAARNVCYASLEAVMLAPQETKVYDVKVRNPWTDALLRVPRLATRASELVRLTKDTTDYKVIQDQALELLKELESIKTQKPPDEVNEQYVAHARQQNEALRDVESRILRLEELFQPHEKPVRFGVPMMDMPRPDRRTTWVIIYIILAFLGVFSLAFFFRWYGRSKSEQLDRQTEKEATGDGDTSKPEKTSGAGGA
jgi:hypothetical protein